MRPGKRTAEARNSHGSSGQEMTILDFLPFAISGDGKVDVHKVVRHGPIVSMLALRSHDSGPIPTMVWTAKYRPIRRQARGRYLAPTGFSDLIFHALCDHPSIDKTSEGIATSSEYLRRLAQNFLSPPWDDTTLSIQGDRQSGLQLQLGEVLLVAGEWDSEAMCALAGDEIGDADFVRRHLTEELQSAAGISHAQPC